MSGLETTLGPVLDMLRSIVTGFAFIAAAYVAAIFGMKSRFKDRRSYRSFVDGLRLVAMAVMALWVWIVAT
jgi:hypothetical protein